MIFSALGGMSLGLFGALFVLSGDGSHNQSADFFHRPLLVSERGNGENQNLQSQQERGVKEGARFRGSFQDDGPHESAPMFPPKRGNETGREFSPETGNESSDFSEEQSAWQDELQSRNEEGDATESDAQEGDIFQGEEVQKKWGGERRQRAIRYCQENHPDYLKECVRDFLQKIAETQGSGLSETNAPRNMKLQKNMQNEEENGGFSNGRSISQDKKGNEEGKKKIDLRKLVTSCLEENTEDLRKCIRESLLKSIQEQKQQETYGDPSTEENFDEGEEDSSEEEDNSVPTI